MLHHALQSGLHFVKGLEAVHALGASTEFSRCLRTAQQQHAHDRGFRADAGGFGLDDGLSKVGSCLDDGRTGSLGGA